MPSILSPQLRDRLAGVSYEARSTSYLGLRPGDLIQFSYMGIIRHGFIIASPAATSGLRYSGRGKSLFNIVPVDDLDDGLFKYLLDNIYGDENTATYTNLVRNSGLSTVNPNTSKEYLPNFRTLQVIGIFSIIKIFIEDE